MTEKKDFSSIFKDVHFPIDAVHIKAVMPFSNINQELFKKYYSPSAVSLQIVMDCAKVLEGFYGEHLFEKDSAKIFFPTRTCDPILIVYDVPMWEDGDYESRETAPYSMCIAIAPRVRLDDERTDEFPKLADLEKKQKQEQTAEVTSSQSKENL